MSTFLFVVFFFSPCFHSTWIRLLMTEGKVSPLPPFRIESVRGRRERACTGKRLVPPSSRLFRCALTQGNSGALLRRSINYQLGFNFPLCSPISNFFLPLHHLHGDLQSLCRRADSLHVERCKIKKIKIKKKKTTGHAHTFGEHRNERYCLVQVLAKQMKQDLIVENLGHCIYLYLCPYIHQIDTLDAATCAQSE